MNLETHTAYSSHDSVNTFTHTSKPVTSSLITIATLNCRSLRKSADPTSSSHFIRYLRDQSIELLALQETHATTSQLQDLFHTQFQAHDSIWSPHCGLICFSQDLTFSNSVLSICGRVITTTVSHKAHRFAPITVTVLYAPASRRDRYEFLSRMMQFDCPFLVPTTPSRHVLLGDFNYTYATHLSTHNRRPQAPATWLNYIASHFVDGVTPFGHSSQPTFLRGTQQSCIDYIFLSQDLVNTRTLGQVHYIQPAWTDHLLLSLRPPLLCNSAPNSTAQTGKGLWRAQPKLASDPLFCSLLASAIANAVDTLDPSLPVDLKWEELKSTLQRVAKHSARLITKLSKNPDCANLIHPQLHIVESQLAEIQQYHVDNLALRASIRWRELGELSPGYLKRTVSTRSSRHLIPPLRHPTSHTISTTRDEMLDAASVFYSQLYSPDTIDSTAVDDLLDSLPEDLRLSAMDCQTLNESHNLRRTS